MKNNPYLKQIRTLIDKILDDKTIKVYLFGSRAKGTERPDSDVDIALQAQCPITPQTMQSLREALEESHIPYLVDLVDLHQCDDHFKKTILKEAQLWKIY